jgi:MYXO-CTERM domain-containing protein
MTRWLTTFLVLLGLIATWSTRAGAQERCPYTPTATIDASTLTTQKGHLKNTAASVCATPKPAPDVLLAPATERYNAYSLKNRSTTAQCISVTLTMTAGGAQSAAYLGSFDPNNIQTNYLGDSGNAALNVPLTYSFNVPALGNFVVAVNEIGAGGATYSLSVTNCGAVVVTSITPNAGPSAGGTAVTIKGSGFLATPGVTIGGTNATDIVLVDEGTITATTPAGADGPADVVVTNTDATTDTLASGFTFVPPSGTTVALVSSVNPSVFGQPVTFTATLTSGAGTPDGNVNFFDGATNIGANVALVGGIATLTKTDFTVGTHVISLQYAGNATFAASTSSDLEQAVTVAKSATALGSSLNPSVSGDAVTFTATVTAVAPGAGLPTGTMTFSSDGAVIGTGSLDGAGKATLTTSALAIGTHAVTAAYGGDAKFGTSASAPALSQVVNAVPVDAGVDSGVDSGTSSGGTSSGGTSSGGTSSGGTSSGGTSSGGTDAGSSAAPSEDSGGGGGCDCRQAPGGSSGYSALIGLVIVAGALVRRPRRTKK